MALEHALSLRLLLRTQCYASALAMMRLQYEPLQGPFAFCMRLRISRSKTLAAALSQARAGLDFDLVYRPEIASRKVQKSTRGWLRVLF
ncbi:DUF6988 family protein [Pseudomonas viridiflava]|uniref:DUF6988 family protein n=1 Tax=Pseudomonas viridiflava TaxID=33069 RepID=UPI003C793329